MRLPRAREPSRSSVGDHKRMENRGRMPVVSARRFGRSLGGEAFRSGRLVRRRLHDIRKPSSFVRLSAGARRIRTVGPPSRKK
jgi:hypothetical protein